MQKEVQAMIEKKPLIPGRIRRISGSFGWVPHRFLRGGFWASLTHHELLLYIFLVLAGDRLGLSYYSFDKICSLLSITPDEYITARNSLIDQDLIAFDGLLFQVLSLPEEPVSVQVELLKSEEDMVRRDPATVHQFIREGMGGGNA
jgi:hypothetical protein